MEVIKTGGGTLAHYQLVSGGPTSAPEGALMIYAINQTASSEGVDKTGTWTKLGSYPAGERRMDVWYKVAGPSEPNTLFELGISDWFAYGYVFFTGAEISSVAASPPTTTATTDFTAPSVNGLAGGALLGFFGAWAASTVYPALTTPTGMVSRGAYASASSSYPSLLAATEGITADGATGARTATGAIQTDDWAAVSISLADSTASTDPPVVEEPAPEEPAVDYQRRYFDPSQVIADVAAATSFADLITAWAPIKTTYGVALRLDDGTITNYGYTSTSFTVDDPECKPAVELYADQLAMYPPEFVKATSLDRIHLVKHLTNTDGTADYGGVAFGPIFYLDIEGMPGITSGSDDGHNGMKLAFHHEFQHTMYNLWQTEFDALLSEWNTHNPAGFYYYGSGGAWRSQDGSRPTGFVRDYGRISHVEDMADTWGHMMTTELQPNLESWIATDPGVAGKVQILKDWVATKSATMTGEGYYDTVHAAFAGDDRAVEPWGQQLIRALGVGTWTKVSGPAVTFTVNGTDLTLDPTPQFTEQQFVFDYGGDQTTITVQPARWGIKQAGAVVPVRLTRKQT